MYNLLNTALGGKWLLIEWLEGYFWEGEGKTAGFAPNPSLQVQGERRLSKLPNNIW